jgi:hypothetical protein
MSQRYRKNPMMIYRHTQRWRKNHMKVLHSYSNLQCKKKKLVWGLHTDKCVLKGGLSTMLRVDIHTYSKVEKESYGKSTDMPKCRERTIWRVYIHTRSIEKEPHFRSTCDIWNPQCNVMTVVFCLKITIHQMLRLWGKCKWWVVRGVRGYSKLLDGPCRGWGICGILAQTWD